MGKGRTCGPKARPSSGSFPGRPVKVGAAGTTESPRRRPAPRALEVEREGSGEVEAVELHDLHPGRDEVVDELLVGVLAGVDLRERAQLGVGAEDQVDRGGG